jgi:energy-coupling factor transporter ATP-binding protein EcfA2
MNILVGPNNCGKSTIIGAFRALVAGVRRARAKIPELVPGPQGDTYGYRVPEENLPISIENVHTDYADTDTTVTFRISNGNRLHLFFPEDGGCFLLPDSEGKPIRTPSAFRNAFPITIAVVPVLGPVEHEEMILKEETVRQGLATHRASRHFRNYWLYNPEGFKDFANLVSKPWPGMQIEPPERVDYRSDQLRMFCIEKRIPREMYWAGFGFQVWCQLLTHISRVTEDSLLIIDEPEVYLHPDVQRQLLGILRDTGPDILIATHSTEIMGEADPSEIVLIDKSKRAGERLQDVDSVQVAMDLIGSVQNITLTQLARTRKLLFVEGIDDFKIIRRFARQLGFIELSSGSGLTPIESEGFSSWERLPSFVWGIEKTFKSSLRIGAIFDHDYWCQEEIHAVCLELAKNLQLAHIHARKEIENYLLVPNVLERAIQKAIADRASRIDEAIVALEPVNQILARITKPLKNETQAQYIEKRAKYLQKSKRDPATITLETIRLFESKWENIDTRMEIVPGKQVLRQLRDEIQSKYGVSLTDFRIINEFKRNEIPIDLCELIKLLEEYRLS